MNSSLKREVVTLTGDGLKAGKNTWLVVNGESMIPFLKPGDKVLAESCAFSQLKKGDIILFSLEDTFFTHRIIRMKEDALQTKGDHILIADPWIKTRQIAGKIVRVDKGTYFWDLRETKWRLLNNLIGWLHQGAVIINIQGYRKDPKLPENKIMRILLRLYQLAVEGTERILLGG
jgi:signal peptidase I